MEIYFSCSFSGIGGRIGFLKLSSMGTSALMLRKYFQSVLLYMNWEIWKERNALLFENSPFMPEKVAKCAILAVKKIWFTKGKPVIPPSHI